jgi:DNA-binding XRE family transcriptional regulator/desulfoferrodoxin (superoxide reductase-like protein)
MDCGKVGNLIRCLRREKGWTQKQLADTMHISDKAVSKWERGMGCPDVSLLPELSEVLGADIEKILSGNLEPNGAVAGNVQKIRFYACPNCVNVLTATGDAGVSCCGRKLAPLVLKPADAMHRLTVENVEDDYFITFSHEMSKRHYIGFIAYVACDRVLFVKLYPEQSGEVRFPKMYGGRIYCYCNRHGLWVNE